ncbi:MAG TPA: lipopolysaccharide kinase [Pseudomonas sabulinigri]|uniref:Protein kinase domain-containing protein n=1 Tax=marine sediment metagenome TaxID=412755 RepID=A0A0F9V7P7_9ZZZZ|nr:lipopolysaccharide kinase [Halopseudomonas sabulinigri]HEC50428.1 lipopolysaccharide kinase [Halopseudomonas sabulinigri]
MTRLPFVAVNANEVLSRHQLDNFEALWALDLEAVDAPNTGRGGWSSVHRLELLDVNGEQQCFYLKRQDNHCTRTLQAPFGEPTFAREFRAVQDYAELGIPALEAAFFARREVNGRKQAVLLTRALDDYAPLDEWFERWEQLSPVQIRTLLKAAGALVRALHNAGVIHNCLYPKHVFLKLHGDGAGARLIDLEKTRRAWFGQRDYVRDLETLDRRSAVPSRTQRLRFVLAYFGQQRLDDESRALVLSLLARRASKAAKR